MVNEAGVFCIIQVLFFYSCCVKNHLIVDFARRAEIFFFLFFEQKNGRSPNDFVLKFKQEEYGSLNKYILDIQNLFVEHLIDMYQVP